MPAANFPVTRHWPRGGRMPIGLAGAAAKRDTQQMVAHATSHAAHEMRALTITLSDGGRSELITAIRHRPEQLARSEFSTRPIQSDQPLFRRFSPRFSAKLARDGAIWRECDPEHALGRSLLVSDSRRTPFRIRCSIAADRTARSLDKPLPRCARRSRECAGIVGAENIGCKSINIVGDGLVVPRIGCSENQRRRDDRAGHDLADGSLDGAKSR